MTSRFDQPDAPDDDPFGDERYLATCLVCGEVYSSRYEPTDPPLCEACDSIADTLTRLIEDDKETECPF